MKNAPALKPQPKTRDASPPNLAARSPTIATASGRRRYWTTLRRCGRRLSSRRRPRSRRPIYTPQPREEKERFVSSSTLQGEIRKGGCNPADRRVEKRHA